MGEDMFFPVLSHFENGNFWTASGGAMRCRVTPDTKAEPPKLTAQVWEGPWSLADSTVEAQAEFPLTEAGLEELRAWLGEWQGVLNARPQKSLAETLAARDACRAERAAAQPEE